MNTLTQNILIFYTLIARDFKTLKKRLPTLFFDGSITVIIAVIMWGSLLPRIGMSQSLIAPIFIGHSLLSLMASIGYNYALRTIYDLKTTRFIDYLTTLPISKPWLFFYFVITCALEISIITIPLITAGIILLGNLFIIKGNLFVFFSFYCVTLLFWSLFFINAAYTHSFNWFRSNIWVRRVMPLIICSSAYYPWIRVEQVSPLISRLMLLNPLTYISEGLRSSLLGGTDYIAWNYCFTAVIFFCIVLCLFVKKNIHRRLDLI